MGSLRFGLQWLEEDWAVTSRTVFTFRKQMLNSLVRKKNHLKKLHTADRISGFDVSYAISTHSSLGICYSAKLSLEFPWLASSFRYGN